MRTVFSFDEARNFFPLKWFNVTSFVRATKEEKDFLREPIKLYDFIWRENVLDWIYCNLGTSHDEKIEVVFRFVELKNKPSDQILICFWEPVSNFVDFRFIQEKILQLARLSQFSVTHLDVMNYPLALSNRCLKQKDGYAY
jgi:hypothetical protein